MTFAFAAQTESHADVEGPWRRSPENQPKIPSTETPGHTASNWAPEGRVAGFSGRREKAQELICRADYSCDLMCGAGPGDLRGSWGLGPAQKPKKTGPKNSGGPRGSDSAENRRKTGPKNSGQTAFRYPAQATKFCRRSAVCFVPWIFEPVGNRRYSGSGRPLRPFQKAKGLRALPFWTVRGVPKGCPAPEYLRFPAGCQFQKAKTFPEHGQRAGGLTAVWPNTVPKTAS